MKRGPGQPKKSPTRTKSFRFNAALLDKAEQKYPPRSEPSLNKVMEGLLEQHMKGVK